MSKEILEYNYDGETGVFTSSSMVFIDPLDGVPMVSANATLIKPPKIKKNHLQIFKDGKWCQEENNLGKTIWEKQSKIMSVVDKLGSIPETHTTIEPKEFETWGISGWILDEEKHKEKIAKSIIGRRNSLLSETDWYVTRFIETGEKIPDEIKDYRQKLRDITSLKGYPNVDLPTKPA